MRESVENYKKSYSRVLFDMKRDMPLASIVILNYNGKSFLGNCLTSVLKTSYPNFEVILVDNGSHDSSVDFVIKKFGENKNLRIVPLSKNNGFAEGNNMGAKYAHGDYLVFLNNDTVVDANWLKNLVKTMESDPKIGAAQAKILLMDGKRIDSTGAYVNYCGFVFNRGHGEEDNGQYDQIDEIFYAKGAAMIVRRSLWDELDGFDPIFFFYSEERDFCWRLWLRGYKIVFVPSAKVYHKGGASVGNQSFLKFHEAKGRIITLIKNYSIKNLFRYVPLTLFMYLFNIFRLVLRRDSRSIISITKSVFWCVWNFNYIWMRRKAQYFLRKRSDEYIKKRIMINTLLPEYTGFVKKASH